MAKGKVYKLKKALCGLKQSPQAGFERFSGAMRGRGYIQSQVDHTLFIKHQHNGLTALIVYVDDIVVTGDDYDEMGQLKKYLSQQFEIKDLGQLHYFLGIEILRSKKGVFLSQRKYVLDLFEEAGMLGCRPCDTPIDPNCKLGEADGERLLDVGRYQRLVGKLIYLSLTRPDIAYAVGLVSQFMHVPTTIHLEATYRILRYLKKSPGMGLLYKKNDTL